jgi:cytochrome c oxidase subunit 2
MAFEVVAQTQAEFDAWLAAQGRPAAAPQDADALAGEQVFMRQCAGCHAVRGTEANGGHAPDLTHIASRRMLAAGMLDNTPDNLMRWIAHAQEVKPGARMPDIALSPQQALQLRAYLEGLR